MGGVYLRLGKIEQGFETLKKAIRLNPHNGVFYENFGRLSLQGCYLEDAAKYLEDYISRFPDTSRCPGLLAEVYFKLRRFEQAKHWAIRALDRQPDNLLVRLVKANAEFSMGRPLEAEESYEIVRQLDSDNVDSLMNLALIAEHKGDTQSAERCYRQLLNCVPLHAVALKRYGALLANKRTDADTLRVLQTAYLANQEDLECLLLLGNLYEKKEMWAEAIELYEQAQRRNAKLAKLASEKIRRLRGMSSTAVSIS